MATHVVCPLCGKSSSLKTFPSASEVDLRLQSFRGRGRGMGFEAVPAGSGLDDVKLAAAVHSKVVEILSTLESRGLPPANLAAARVTAEKEMREKISALERGLELERTTRKTAESELKMIKEQLELDRRLRLTTLAQVGKLSSQLDRAKTTQEQLVAASRQCIASLRALRDQAKGSPFAAQTLAHVVHDLKAMVDLVHELRFVSATTSSAAGAPLNR